MIKKSMVFVVTMVLVSAAVRADVTHSVTYFPGTLQDRSGTPITDGTLVFIADLDGDGWDGNDYLSVPGLPDPWLWDTDDLLFGLGQIGGANPDGMGGVAKQIFTDDLPDSYSAGVDNVYALWFVSPFNPGDTGPGWGVDYGVAHLGTVGTDPGSYTWVIQSGNYPATLTTPEPASMLLMLAGGGVLAVLRRRRRING